MGRTLGSGEEMNSVSTRCTHFMRHMFKLLECEQEEGGGKCADSFAVEKEGLVAFAKDPQSTAQNQ